MNLLVKSYLDLHLLFLAKLLGFEILAIVPDSNKLEHKELVYNYYANLETVILKTHGKRVEFASSQDEIFSFFKQNCTVVKSYNTNAHSFKYDDNPDICNIELSWLNSLIKHKYLLFDMLAFIYHQLHEINLLRRNLYDTTPFYFLLTEMFSKERLPNIYLSAYKELHIAAITNHILPYYTNITTFSSKIMMLEYEEKEQIKFDIVFSTGDRCMIKEIDWVQIINECSSNLHQVYSFKVSVDNWYCNRLALDQADPLAKESSAIIAYEQPNHI